FWFTAWKLQRANQFKRIDQDLQHRVAVIASVMRRPGERLPGAPPDRFRPQRGPPEDELRPPSFDRPPGQPEAMPPPLRNGIDDDFLPPPPRELHLSAQDLLLFEGSPSNAFY